MAGVARGDADDQAGGRHDAIVGAENAGTQPTGPGQRLVAFMFTPASVKAAGIQTGS
jgi:hypothetical protein